MFLRSTILTIVFCLISISANSQHFAASLLEKCAEELNLTELDDLPNGHNIIEKSGVKLVIIKKGNRIDHIGRPLFSKVLREQYPLSIYNYLEYAWLEQSLLKNTESFLHKEVQFAQGDWILFEKVNEQSLRSINTEDNALYHISWSLPGGQLIDINVPLSYDKISTATRGEKEAIFIEDLRNNHSVAFHTPEIDTTLLTPYDSLVYVLDGETYLQPLINSNTYYYRSDQGYELINNTNRLPLTLPNLFLTPQDSNRAWQIDILFLLHGARQDTININAADFADYLHSSGGHLFWGNEGSNEEMITGTLFAYYPQDGYNHIFKITCPTDSQKHLSCKASLFVPTTNIQNLHRQYVPKNEKDKIKW